MPIEIIYHEGFDIIFIDYSYIKDQNEMLALLAEARSIIESAPPGMVLLTNMTRAIVGDNFMTEAKKLGRNLLKSKSKKHAILGIEGLKTMLLRAYNLFTEDKIMPFGSREKALAYLISDEKR